MPKPYVKSTVEDLTTRVNSVGTFAAAIVIAAKKGPVNVPVLVTSQTDFLRRYTPNETIELGWDSAYHEAFQYLANQGRLYVVRAAHTSDLADDENDSMAMYGGCNISLYKSSNASKPLKKGFLNEDQIPPLDIENDAMIIYGTDPGAYNNDLAVKIITDPKVVKLDGCFIIEVYKKDRNTKLYVKVEEHVCSLDASMKNGYGVNCYVENVLQSSNYIKASANEVEDAIMDASYTLELDGSVTFDNEYIKKGTARVDSYAYNKGDVIKVTELPEVVGYYECTVAGRAADHSSAPTFSAQSKYQKTVTDNKAEWTLVEVVKKYHTETAYEMNDIVDIESSGEHSYFRCINAGTTSDAEPSWKQNSINDGAVVWVNQHQVIDVVDGIAYTEREGEKSQTFDLGQYKAYSDMYLTTLAYMPKTKTILDPTKKVADAYGDYTFQMVEKDVTYTAKYTGDQSAEHIILPMASDALIPLAGGADGSEPTTGDRIAALNTMSNRKTYEIQLIMDGGYCINTYHRAMDEFCEKRNQATHGICSVPYDAQMVNDNGASVLEYRNITLNANTTNLELYTPHQLIYDQFNDKNIIISPSSFVAAKIMEVAQDFGWHFVAAGYNRGILNTLSVAKTWEDGVIDSFSDAQINTIISEPGSGNIIFDNLTLMSKACDLQDAHISRYVNIRLRPAVEELLKNFLFEFNDAETRTLIVKKINNFMEPEKSARAVQDYYVVCDETNNLPNDIQNNICNVWLYVMPTKAIKYINLKVIISPQGSSIQEVVEV